MIFGLSINLHKTMVLGIEDDSNFTLEIANELHCRSRPLLMNYLRISMGGKVLNCKSWDYLVDLFKFISTQWKAKHLSMGVRLALIKSVLNSIAIYVLFVRILPVGVQNKLHNLRSKFLWGGSANSRKLHLVDWNMVSFLVDRGALDITRLENLNTALIVQWIYRYVNELNNLWRRIVSTMSGTDLGRLFPCISNSTRKSLLFNLIGSLQDRNSMASDPVIMGSEI